MLVNELAQWNIIKKTWVVGERREHFEAETSIWKMVSRVFRERELRWIRTAHEAFAEAGSQLPAGDDARHRLIADRVAGLTQLAAVGEHLLTTMLEGEAIDSLPIKTVGELANAAREARPGGTDEDPAKSGR
jgi:DNA-binding transcriptional regulator GbsR (MarR family)